MILLDSIFLLIAGTVMLIGSNFLYDLLEKWKSSAPSKPSELYRLHLRVGGIVCIVVGAAGLIFSVLSR